MRDRVELPGDEGDELGREPCVPRGEARESERTLDEPSLAPPSLRLARRSELYLVAMVVALPILLVLLKTTVIRSAEAKRAPVTQGGLDELGLSSPSPQLVRHIEPTSCRSIGHEGTPGIELLSAGGDEQTIQVRTVPSASGDYLAVELVSMSGVRHVFRAGTCAEVHLGQTGSAKSDTPSMNGDLRLDCPLESGAGDANPRRIVGQIFFQGCR